MIFAPQRASDALFGSGLAQTQKSEQPKKPYGWSGLNSCAYPLAVAADPASDWIHTKTVNSAFGSGLAQK